MCPLQTHTAFFKSLSGFINPVNSETVLFRKEQVLSSPGKVCGSTDATIAGQQKATQAKFASDHERGCPDSQSTLPSTLGHQPSDTQELVHQSHRQPPRQEESPRHC